MNKQETKVNWKDGQTVMDKEGNVLFVQGFILKKFNRLLTGLKEDTFVPTPVFISIETGEIITEGLPIEVREVADYQNSKLKSNVGNG